MAPLAAPVEGDARLLPILRNRWKDGDRVLVIGIQQHLIDVAQQGCVGGDFGGLPEIVATLTISPKQVSSNSVTPGWTNFLAHAGIIAL